MKGTERPVGMEESVQEDRTAFLNFPFGKLDMEAMAAGLTPRG